MIIYFRHLIKEELFLKKKTKSTIIIGVGLVLLSLFLHYLHYLIFQDAHHTLIFLVADIAFVPMEVFFTTFVLDKLIEKREHSHILEKLNMLIGLFFSELGTDLLKDITKGDGDLKIIKQDSIKENFDDTIVFDILTKDILTHRYNIDISKINLKNIKTNLEKNRDLLITLLTNDSLLDHENFTEMLMAIMHLKEELNSRYNTEIEKYELEHIEKDIETAYKYLAIEWAQYMKYLKNNYPVLFTKALINNPFDDRCKKEKDIIYLGK